jgi:hypothetical protein
MGKNPEDLTIGDCFAARHQVFLSCGRCRMGRHLDYTLTGAWVDCKLLDLAREGRFVCKQCGEPSSHLSVWGHLVAAAILRWSLGDGAMPGK